MELPQSTGFVYSWGLGDSGALGNGKPQSESVPFKVKLPEKIF
jgi:alpha-tubulin suppressor-like RCC1 family protein